MSVTVSRNPFGYELAGVRMGYLVSSTWTPTSRPFVRGSGNHLVIPRQLHGSTRFSPICTLLYLRFAINDYDGDGSHLVL